MASAAHAAVDSPSDTLTARTASTAPRRRTPVVVLASAPTSARADTARNTSDRPQAGSEPRPDEVTARRDAADPYGFLDVEPDFAWRSADGRLAIVATIDDTQPPDWLRRSARERKQARWVNAASWLITATVLVCVVAVAGLVMLGSDRFAPAFRELTGLDVARETGGDAGAQVPTGSATPAAVPAATTSAAPAGPVRTVTPVSPVGSPVAKAMPAPAVSAVVRSIPAPAPTGTR